MFLFGNREKTCVRIPLKTKGRLFVSPMPFGPYDPGNRLLKIYKKNRIEFAVMLVTDIEIEKKAKRDILAIYKQNHIEAIRLQTTPAPSYTLFRKWWIGLRAISKPVQTLPCIVMPALVAQV